MIESDLSHPPSAEFLERLERVNKQEPFISSVISDNLIGSGGFAELQDPLMASALQSEVDPTVLKEANKLLEQEDPLSQSERQDRSNFKN